MQRSAAVAPSGADGSADGGAGSIWAHKPWWCQPWTILLTGVVAVLFSWLLLNRWWITLPLGLAVLAWWTLFLVIVPAAWLQAARSNHSAADHTAQEQAARQG